ncbi:phosphate ABC transporter permease PstA [bacterium]|nr:phosphate ABC transporter permease PstA [bacterium]
MRPRSRAQRRAADMAIRIAMVPSALVGIAVLAWILWEVIARGVGALTPAFFIELPTPPGMEGGGLGNAIVGTLLMTLSAALLGTPIGLLAGVFLSEFGPSSRIATVVRFTTNLLMGTPSIIIGIFVYSILVLPFGHFSGWAGAVALAILILPVVMRTTEDMLNLVPDELRESGLALGAPRWRVTLGIVFRAARTGLVTGVLLAVARVSGETAPLLFTALNSFYWPGSLNEPTANLTVTIFNYAMSPYSDWQQKAWGASLLITVSVLVVAVLARFVIRDKRGKA